MDGCAIRPMGRIAAAAAAAAVAAMLALGAPDAAHAYMTDSARVSSDMALAPIGEPPKPKASLMAAVLDTAAGCCGIPGTAASAPPPAPDAGGGILVGLGGMAQAADAEGARTGEGAADAPPEARMASPGRGFPAAARLGAASIAS